MRTIKSMLKANTRPKKIMLLETAFSMFRKHGFQRVTVAEICSLAKISKVTFYRYFSGKDELILVIIRLFVDEILADIEHVLDSGISIKEVFDHIAMLKQKFVAHLGEEIMRGIVNIPAARQYTDDLSQRIWAALQALLLTEQEKGNINGKLNIQQSISFIRELNIVLGANNFKDIYANPQEMICQVNELIVMGLISRDETK